MERCGMGMEMLSHQLIGENYVAGLIGDEAKEHNPGRLKELLCLQIKLHKKPNTKASAGAAKPQQERRVGGSI